MKLRTLVAAIRSALCCWTSFGPTVVCPQFFAQLPAAMYPYYTVASGGRNASEVMDFNLHVWSSRIEYSF